MMYLKMSKYLKMIFEDIFLKLTVTVRFQKMGTSKT